MALQKPRYGGAQNKMETSRHIKDPHLVEARQSHESDTVSATACRLLESSKQLTALEASKSVEKFKNLDRLMQVFKELGIQCEPKPYIRNSDEALPVCDHDGTLQENVLASSRTEELYLSKENKVVYCKNLFLKDRRGQFYIVVCLEEHTIDLKALKQSLNAHRNLSFGDNEALQTVLQLKVGEVTPLAIMHESARNVRVAVHSQLADANAGVKFAFHPLCGKLQVELSYSELVTFVEHFGRTIEIITNDSIKCQKTVATNNNIAELKAKQNSQQSKTEKKNQNSKVGPSSKRHNIPTYTDKEHNEYLPIRSIDTNSFQGTFKKNLTKPLSESTKFDNPDEMNVEKNKNASFDMDDYQSLEISEQHKTETEKIFLEEKNVQPENTSKKTGFSLENQDIQSDKAKPFVNVKPTKRIFLSRKGKLRSYVQQNAHTSTNIKACSISDTQEETELLGAENNEEKILLKDCETEYSYNTEKSSEIHSNHANNTFLPPLEDIEIDPNSTCSRLEIIEQFYSSLNTSGVMYEEIDLSSEGTDTIPPSVGCRCFLLKDKSGNFFFVVSHELYELDFGRLKAALRPKKKLSIAQPADIITVLGVDPMKMSPFAVLTMKKPQPKVYITQKAMSPNLMLCVQHPFAQARRILIRSAQLQNYFRFLEIDFQTVEEKQWHPKYNFPFSQFDKPQAVSEETKPQEILSDVKTSEYDVAYNPDPHSKKPYQAARRLPSDVNFPLFLSIPYNILSSITFPLIQYVSQIYKASKPTQVELSDNHEFLHESSVDAPQKLENFSEIKFLVNENSITSSVDAPQKLKNFSEINSQVSENSPVKSLIENISVPMTTKHLEEHLLSQGIKFEMKAQKKQAMETRVHYTSHKDNASITEHCSVMYLTNSRGHNFLIIGAQDEFPLSVKRFCRRSRIREHLDILIDPQDEGDVHVLDDIAPRMIPFALAFVNLRNMIRDRFSSLNRTSAQSLSHTAKHTGHTEVRMSLAQSSEQTESLPVTVALTTTLYIDPETIMEFTIGKKGSKLRLTSSEFEKYCGQVGFEILYY